LIFNDAIAQFQRLFLEKHGLVLEIPQISQEWIREKFGSDPKHILDRLMDMFANYEYGMKLAGKQSLQVTTDVLENPNEFLDVMVKQAYEQKQAKA
jgi:hypothetical protein